MPARIMIVSFAIPDPGGSPLGISTHILARTLQAQGHEVLLVRPVLPQWLKRLGRRGRTRVPASYELDGVRILAPRVWMLPIGRQRRRAATHAARVVRLTHGPLVRALRPIMDDFQPEGLMVRQVFPLALPVVKLAEKRGLPVVGTEESQDDLEAFKAGTPSTQIFRDMAMRLRCTYAVGPQMVTYLREQLGISNAKFVPNGVLPPTPESLEKPRPEALAGKKLVLCVSGYYRRKGLELLVEAFGRLRERHADAKLVMIGGHGPLPELIDQLGLKEHVHLYGAVSHEEVRQWMVWADLFALPSWQEAFGLVYGEAMLAGCATLMTSDCGVARVVLANRDKLTGQAGGETDLRGEGGAFVVEPKNLDAVQQAMDLALSDAALRQVVAERGRRLAEVEFTWQRFARELVGDLGLA